MSPDPGAVQAGCPGAPRVLALCLPELPLQRVLRAREAAGVRGSRAPLAVVGGGRVVACDAEARACGIAPGDALVEARAACADLEALDADEAADRAALEGLAEALLAIAPAVEIASPDALLLDASGASLLAHAGDPSGEATLSQRAVELASGLGFRCRTAVAWGRGPARALARCARGGPADADGKGGRSPMAALPLHALELAPALAGRLAALGLRSVGDLAQLPPSTLGHRFGAPGLEAWRLAQGDDPSPLVPHVPSALPRETLELEDPLTSFEPLLFGLKRLCDSMAARLAGRGLGATRLELVLALDPRGEEQVTIALAQPSSAASRWLLVLRERLEALRLEGAVAGASLEVVEAAPASSEQLSLGDRAEQLAALDIVLLRLAARLGDGAVFAAEPVERHRPEAAYRPRAFASARRRGETSTPSRPEGEKRKKGERVPPSPEVQGSASPPSEELERPTRLLPRPQAVIALGEGGRLAAVRLGDRTLRVLAISPAERLWGEWWNESFQRDYHRARLEGLGECWIFWDAADGRLWLHGFFD